MCGMELCVHAGVGVYTSIHKYLKETLFQVLSPLEFHFTPWAFPKTGHSEVSLYFGFCPVACIGLLWWFVLRKYFRLIFYLFLLKEYQLSWHSIILKSSVNKITFVQNSSKKFLPIIKEDRKLEIEKPMQISRGRKIKYCVLNDKQPIKFLVLCVIVNEVSY